jgi:hypothetical protein
MAPAADLVYLGTGCDDDLDALSGLDAFADLVDHRLATIVSRSWGPVTNSPGLIAHHRAATDRLRRGRAQHPLQPARHPLTASSSTTLPSNPSVWNTPDTPSGSSTNPTPNAAPGLSSTPTN